MLKQGLAKTLFSDTYQRTPWRSFKDKKGECRWPLLDRLFSKNNLSYLDYLLTQRLLRHEPHVREEVALSLCHLILAAKEGHLCVHVNLDGLHPSVTQLWKNEEGEFLTIEEVEDLTHLIMKGMQMIPEGILTTFNQKNFFQSEIPFKPICREGNKVYLQRHWMFETLFLKYFDKHLKTPSHLELEIEKIKKTLTQLYEEKILLQEQTEAILQACINPLTLVTGGPGTGKTYTAGHLIKIFWEHLSQEQKKSCQIILAAPTGKAAANLQHSLSKVTASLDQFPTIQAKTLHALLGIRQGALDLENVRLTADLIVVDESSMIDVRMMARLFESLKPGSRLILLGDKHQLPSVEAGSMFMDLIQMQQAYPKLKMSCISLSLCMRAELISLIDFAQLINQGNAQQVLDYLNGSVENGIKRLSFSVDKKEAQHDFLSYVLPHFLAIIKKEQSPEQLLGIFQNFRILSPLRKGPFGVESLNRLIWQKLCQSLPRSGCVAIPIIVTANDYRQELFNGETGVLIRHLPLQSTIRREDYALFPSRKEGSQVRRLSALLLTKYEYAYCLSVHKSQGSEFDCVILALPEGAEIFGREVFYTAITRARRSIEIYGSDEVILKTVEQQGIRLSGIEDRLMAREERYE